MASQVLCMIAWYHLACATMGSTTTSPILPKAVEQYLPPLVDYARPGGTGLTDVRVRDHKSHSLCIGVWLHQVDMSLSWEREASESLVQSRHIKRSPAKLSPSPRDWQRPLWRGCQSSPTRELGKHERVKERFRSSLNSSCRRRSRLSQELDKLSQGIEAAADRKLHKLKEG